MAGNRPDAQELMACLRDSLKALATRATGGDAFELKVCVKALEILAREARLGAAADADEVRRLGALLGHDASLPDLRRDACARLADGRLRHDDAAVLEILRAGVLQRLAIDNPDFQ